MADPNLEIEVKLDVQLAIPMLLWCPGCSARHIDEGEFATKPHHTHACQACGMVWRPALVPTVGVQFLPGFKNAPVVDKSASPGRQGYACAHRPFNGDGDCRICWPKAGVTEVAGG